MTFEILFLMVMASCRLGMFIGVTLTFIERSKKCLKKTLWSWENYEVKCKKVKHFEFFFLSGRMIYLVVTRLLKWSFEQLLKYFLLLHQDWLSEMEGSFNVKTVGLQWFRFQQNGIFGLHCYPWEPGEWEAF